MSRAQTIGDWKVKNQYLKNAKKCCTCKHYIKGYTELINSLPRTQLPICGLGAFNTRSYSICNSWDEIKSAEVLK